MRCVGYGERRLHERFSVSAWPTDGDASARLLAAIRCYAET